MIGGKELDLHVLYVEATKRGGYEKVSFFYYYIRSFDFPLNTHLFKCKTFYSLILIAMAYV